MNNLNFLPRTLKNGDAQLNLAGQGRISGAVLYLDHSGNRVLELLPARVITTGAAYSMVEPLGNDTLGVIQLPSEALQPCLNGTSYYPRTGDLVMVGPIDFVDQRPRARYGWRLPLPGVGLIHVVSPDKNAGVILQEKTGQLVPFPSSALTPGTRLAAGQRVRFFSERAQDGFTAKLVHAA